MFRSNAFFLGCAALLLAVGCLTFTYGGARNLSDKDLDDLSGGAVQRYCWPCDNCSYSWALCEDHANMCKQHGAPCSEQDISYWPEDCTQTWGNEYCENTGARKCICEEKYNCFCRDDGEEFFCEKDDTSLTGYRVTISTDQITCGCSAAPDNYQFEPGGCR
jgi:hypothetical protein